LSRSNALPEKLRNLVSINDDNSTEDEEIDRLHLEHVQSYEGVNELA
jgi:hypothetical protein